jgi:hypothetical protein
LPKRLGCAILLILVASFAQALEPAEAIDLPATAIDSWTPRERCIYILGVIHGELDLAIRVARADIAAWPDIALLVVHTDTLELQAAKLAQHIADLSAPDHDSTLFASLMAARWEIYPNNDIAPVAESAE